MTLSLTERRAALREAVGGDAADFKAFARALDGASEEDRAALAKTLPPSRLCSAEGLTPRAGFVLAALGKPKLAAEALTPIEYGRRDLPEGYDAALAQAVIAAGAGRDAQWRAAFVELLAERYWWSKNLAWPVCLGLVRLDEDLPLAEKYLSLFVHQLSEIGGDGQSDEDHGRIIASHMQAQPDLIEREFWALFSVEGMGAEYRLLESTGAAWDAAILALCLASPDFRQRLLAESREALLRDFAAKTIAWYLRAHRLADPSAEEVVSSQHSYFAVLGTAPSTAVGLAQDMLKRAVERLDVDAMVEAARPVLTRSEKKLVKAQLALLAALKADAGQQEGISQLVSEVLEGMPLDLVPQARKLLLQTEDRAAVPTGEEGSPATLILPEPRRKPLAALSAPQAIGDDDELHALIGAQLEGVGHGADLARIYAYLAGRAQHVLPAASQERAAEIIASVWDGLNASPRRLLAAALLGETSIRFKGYARYVFVNAGEPDPAGIEIEEQTVSSSSMDAETGEWSVEETWTTRSGYQYLPTHSPLGLLADTLHQLALCRVQGKAIDAPVPLAAQTLVWERVLAEPGEGMFPNIGQVLGEGVKPFWMTKQTGVVPALDLAAVPAEFTFRAQEGRELDCCEQAVQWAAWLLQANPDTLAAHYHPLLCAAVAVINVRGLGPLLSALGESRQVPGGPVYSALALGASAKMTEQRAQAAEAIARLADSGLLDPVAFAGQIAVHLAQGYALAGRVAQTLADAASISALAGARVLQTLQALLPQLLDADGKPVAQAVKLIELAARLSNDYGMPLVLPAELAARRKGASVLAVTLRSLEAVEARGTPLAAAAAKAAQQALDQA